MKTKLLLLCIILLGFFLRFYHLGSNPPSLTWDEVAWGYNAYSLGIDGKDEFGRYLPVDYLESFGDFKPPMYAYLDILPVKIFGLNEFATRFPSALFGTLTVLTTYFLVLEIFKNIPTYSLGKRSSSRSKDSPAKSTISSEQPMCADKQTGTKASQGIALFAALFLAISPWHIILSRAAFEANVASFFLVVGVWLFLASIHGKTWYLPVSIASFVLSLYIFNSSRVVAPLLVSALIIGFYKVLWQRKVQALIAFSVGLLLILPIAKFLISPQAGLRFKEVNIFSDVDVVKTANQEIANDHNSTISKLLHNRRLAYTVSYLNHYFDNLSPDFLFLHGDGNPKFSTQDVGQMYIWNLLFFIAGILLLFKFKEGNWWVIPVWLLLGITAAATARETPHALRIEATLPTFQILTAYGFYYVITNLKSINKNYKLQKGLTFGIYFLLLCNVLYFLHGYFTHYPREFSGEWQYGYKDSISYVQSVKNNYEEVDITDELGRPYIYYLFYTQTSPDEFRKAAKVSRDSFGFVTINGFEGYRFKRVLVPNKKIKTLYVDTPSHVPTNAKVLKIFYLLNGKPIIVVYGL